MKKNDTPMKLDKLILMQAEAIKIYCNHFTALTQHLTLTKKDLKQIVKDLEKIVDEKQKIIDKIKKETNNDF